MNKYKNKYYSEEAIFILWKLKEAIKERGDITLDDIVPPSLKDEEIFVSIISLGNGGMELDYKIKDDELKELRNILQESKDPTENKNNEFTDIKEVSEKIIIVPRDEEKVEKELNDYINNFVNNNLTSEKNFLLYDKQKKVAFDYINRYRGKVCNPILLKMSPGERLFKAGFLPVHTFVALDEKNKLNLVDLKDIDDHNLICNVRKLLVDVKIDNVDFSEGILSIKGDAIDFNNAKKQKEFMQVLFSDPQKEWLYIDIKKENSPSPVLVEDNWDKQQKHNLKKRAYDINKKIKNNTSIEKELLKRDKEKVKINPYFL